MSNFYNDQIYDELADNDDFLTDPERMKVQAELNQGNLEEGLYLSRMYARPRMDKWRDLFLAANETIKRAAKKR